MMILKSQSRDVEPFGLGVATGPGPGAMSYLVSRVESMRHIDLSHVVTDGMQTYPGLPTPQIADHLTREAAEQIYGPGVTFQIGLVTMCTNTGTYIDVPFHRYAHGHDLTELSLDRVAGVPAVCLDYATLGDQIDFAAFEGHAVLIRTGHSGHWGSAAYFETHPSLTAEHAHALVAADVACVGIDSLNIDSTDTSERPVHTILLGNDIPIIEHLTNLDSLPDRDFTFTAVPPKIQGAGTFTVRAFATV